MWLISKWGPLAFAFCMHYAIYHFLFELVSVFGIHQIVTKTFLSRSRVLVVKRFLCQSDQRVSFEPDLTV